MDSTSNIEVSPSVEHDGSAIALLLNAKIQPPLGGNGVDIMRIGIAVNENQPVPHFGGQVGGAEGAFFLNDLVNGAAGRGLDRETDRADRGPSCLQQ
jgi:hypothetical protein